MSDKGSGYMISLGDDVIAKDIHGDMIDAKLVQVDLSGDIDTIQLENGDFMKIERTGIFPKNVKEIFSYNVMKNELSKGICEVTFTKKNGEERVMPCTLDFYQIPEEHHPKGNNTVSKQEVISAWCTDKNGWRSFRVDSVNKFTTSENIDVELKEIVNENI